MGELLLVEVSIPNHLLVHIVSILNIQSFGRSNCLINHVFHSFVLTCCIPWAFRDLWWLLSFYKSKIASNYFVRFFICLGSRFHLILYLWFPLLLQRVHTLGTLLVQFSPASELTSAVPMVILNQVVSLRLPAVLLLWFLWTRCLMERLHSFTLNWRDAGSCQSLRIIDICISPFEILLGRLMLLLFWTHCFSATQSLYFFIFSKINNNVL